MVDKWFARAAILLGFGLLTVSAALYVVLHRAASREQALSPGHKNFAVAALAMDQGPRILWTGGAGVLSLSLGIAVARRLGKRTT
jgi:hypothetical protein